MKRRYRVKLANLMITATILLMVLGLSINFAIKAAATDDVPTGGGQAWQQVVVDNGDTLWCLAEKYAPESDPREFIHLIREVNSLATATLQPGQVLTLPVAAGDAQLSLANL